MAAPLSDRLLARDPRAIARAISLIEDEAPEGADLVGRIFTHSGRAYLIGVTGPPGAGKSTLVDKLIGELRQSGKTVGVLCVDPTSPFSGGAILGDRVRMQAHAEDDGVFIRSMATRIQAARLLTYRAAWLKDQGVARTGRESSMAKLYSSEIAVRAAEESVQIHGGYGFIKDYPAEKFFRDVKLCTIGEGTSEIQRLVIARQLLGQ